MQPESNHLSTGFFLGGKATSNKQSTVKAVKELNGPGFQNSAKISSRKDVAGVGSQTNSVV